LKGWRSAGWLALLLAWRAAGAAPEEPGPRFLAEPPANPVHHHTNRITIDAQALRTGWARLRQCHTHMDALGATQIVFNAGRIREIEVVSSSHIARIRVRDDRVLLDGVEHGAAICLRAETRSVERRPDASVVVRNGPFMRRFLDSYFPMHVTLEVRYPADQLRFRSIQPSPQPGLALQQEPGRVTADAWFSGVLRTRLRFRPR